MSKPRFKFGWIPDVPDHRDLAYFAPRIGKLPARVDLRAQCPPVFNQGRLGSCTANAIAGAHQFCQMAQVGGTDFTPSRLFIYFNERRRQGTIMQDSGAYIRDGFKSIAQEGVCPEKMWPYNDGPFKFRNAPTPACYAEALKHQAIDYRRVPQTETQIKGCLAEGFPIVFGFTVYESFMGDRVASTGIMPMPSKKERAEGGHAVLAVGYDDDLVIRRKSYGAVVIVRNSWDITWGDKGNFYMPIGYLVDDNLSADLWTLRLTEE